MADPFDVALAGLRQAIVDLDGDGVPDATYDPVSGAVQRVPDMSGGAPRVPSFGTLSSGNTPAGDVLGQRFGPAAGAAWSQAERFATPIAQSTGIPALTNSQSTPAQIARGAVDLAGTVFPPVGAAVAAGDAGASAWQNAEAGKWLDAAVDASLIGLAGIGGYGAYRAGRNILGRGASATPSRIMPDDQATRAGAQLMDRATQIEARARPPAILPTFQPRRVDESFDTSDIIGPWGARGAPQNEPAPAWISQTRMARENYRTREALPYTQTRNALGQFVSKEEELERLRGAIDAPRRARLDAERVRMSRPQIYEQPIGPDGANLFNALKDSQLQIARLRDAVARSEEIARRLGRGRTQNALAMSPTPWGREAPNPMPPMDTGRMSPTMNYWDDSLPPPEFLRRR